MNSVADQTMVEGAIRHFPACGYFQNFVRITQGHINDTFRVKTDKGEYLLQRLSPTAFKKPLEVMHNIAGVTAFLRKKIIEEDGNPDQECLNLVPSNDGECYWMDECDHLWRVYLFIEGMSYDSPKSPELFQEAAKAFGRFQHLLSEYPASDLYEVIPHFHDTPKRFKDLEASLAKDPLNRKKDCMDVVNLALERKDKLSKIVDGLKDGSLPLRTTHNDTKLNNIMFDPSGTNPLCILDLDTIMPGSALYDFGDSIRFGANTCVEDEKDTSKIHFNLEMFKAYAKGFVEGAAGSLTEKEIRLFPYCSMLLTYECGIRFLADYLDGDIYFHTAYEGHNLVRARDQFALLLDMERQQKQMDEFIEELLEK